MTPEIRLSPSGVVVAIRNLKHAERPELTWRGSNGSYLTDALVADWTPLLPVSTPDRVTCPWCATSDRKVTKNGRLYSHGQPNVFPPQHCEGSGRFPSDYAAITGGTS